MPRTADYRAGEDEGYDLDLTMILDHGTLLAWTIQRRVAGCSVVEFIESPEILELGRRIKEHFGYHGVIDFDIRHDTRENVPYVIECDLRFPGTMLYKLWAGVNLPAIGVGVALGEAAPTDYRPPVGMCRDPGISPKLLI